MRFAYLFATLATAATSLVAAAPVASPNAAASAQSISDALSSVNSQLGPLVDKFNYLTHPGSSDVDFDGVNSVTAQITDLIETARAGITDTNAAAAYITAEEGESVILFVEYTETITADAVSVAAVATGAVHEALGDLSRKVMEVTNALVAAIEIGFWADFSSDIAIVKAACDKIDRILGL